MLNKSNKELKELALIYVTEGLETFEDQNFNLSPETLDHLWNVEIFVMNTRAKGLFGRYRHSKDKTIQKIQIFPQNFKNQNLVDFKDTVLHELAHHLTSILYGFDAQAHGSEWKEMCAIVGADPTATSEK